MTLGDQWRAAPRSVVHNRWGNSLPWSCLCHPAAVLNADAFAEHVPAAAFRPRMVRTACDTHRRRRHCLRLPDCRSSAAVPSCSGEDRLRDVTDVRDHEIACTVGDILTMLSRPRSDLLTGFIECSLRPTAPNLAAGLRAPIGAECAHALEQHTASGAEVKVSPCSGRAISTLSGMLLPTTSLAIPETTIWTAWPALTLCEEAPAMTIMSSTTPATMLSKILARATTRFTPAWTAR